jgi:glycosyltransferase involved in cell wall biosynthesis
MIPHASKLSVAIIARDEEARIGDCLESVQWVDEIVVVDTGSGDRTLEICQKYPCHVHRAPWQGYAAAKNLALTLTTGDLLLSLDADERVSQELRAEIASLRQQALETLAEGYAIPRRNYCWGRWLKHGGLYPDYQLRLFKRGKGRFGERRVHESVEVDGRVAYLASPLEHYSYRGLSEVIARLNHYSDLAAQDRAEHGPPFHGWALVMRPLARFLRNYLLKQGFRDGLPGLIMAVSYAYGVFAREAKLWELASSHQAPPTGPRER